MDYKKEYEILDACNELQARKIKYLIEENTKLNAIIDGYQPRLQALKDENERLKHSEKDLSRICQGFKRDIETEKSSKIKYYKTLQEIKEIAEKLMADNLCNNCDGIGLDANCQDTGCPYYQMDKILQKINKAEEE